MASKMQLRRPGRYNVGQRVMHALHGIGMVEKVVEKNILGSRNKFHVISFQNDRLKIMVNLNQRPTLIRHLINQEEIPKVLRFLKECKSELPPKSSERYNVNLKKIKTADIYQLAEVVKDLTDLSKVKKLSPKELAMLKQTKKMLSSEFSYVSKITPEEMDTTIDQIFNLN